MKRTARRFSVREQTFGLCVEFYCGTPQLAAVRRCAAVLQLDAADPENAPDELAVAWAMCHGSFAVVWMEDMEDTGSLVHELYHVTQDFLNHVQAKDEETGAYLISYLFRKAHEKLTRKN